MNVKVLMNKNTGQLGLGFQCTCITSSEEVDRLDVMMSDEIHKVVMIDRLRLYWVIQSDVDQPFVFIFDQTVVGEQLEVLGEL